MSYNHFALTWRFANCGRNKVTVMLLTAMSWWNWSDAKVTRWVTAMLWPVFLYIIYMHLYTIIVLNNWKSEQIKSCSQPCQVSHALFAWHCSAVLKERIKLKQPVCCSQTTLVLCCSQTTLVLCCSLHKVLCCYGLNRVKCHKNV